ncbi:MAG: TA system VapC family ribonuclease toxin [Myxococcota bacterium]
MSYALDVNVLVYASDRSGPNAARAAKFLERCAADGEILCLAWTTVMGYLRIATHPAIFAAPLSPEEAMRNIEALLALPHARLLTEEDGFWRIYRETAKRHSLRGNLVPDAHLAALLRQHGVRTLYTSDTDLRKFEFLDVRDPLA